MNRKFFKGAGALLLSLSMIFTPFAGVYALPEKLSPEQIMANTGEVITRGEFAVLINSTFGLTGAEGDNFLDVPVSHPYAADLLCAKNNGYLSGDGTGNVNPDAILSGAEAAVIINRLLGFDVTKVALEPGLQTPDWAVPSASVLLDLKMINKEIIAQKELKVNDAAAFLTALSVAAMFPGSPYALSQKNLKDDFFAYTNRQYLATKTIEPGYPYAMAFADVGILVQNQQSEILAGILNEKNLIKDSDEWKVNELFNMYMDNEARTKSISRLTENFDEIRAVSSIKELIELYKKYIELYDFQPFYKLSPVSDAKLDAMKYAVILMSAGYDMGSKDYYVESDSNKPVQEAYRAYLGKLLNYIGETEDIEDRVNKLYEIEKKRAERDLPTEAYMDPNAMYKPVTWEEALDLTKTTGYLTMDGEVYDIVKDFNIYCPNPDYIKYAESLYTEENLQTLKDYMLLNFLSANAIMLGDDLADLSDDFTQAITGQPIENAPLITRSQSFVTSMMSDVFSRLYAEKFCSEKVKNDVTDIIATVQDKYRERIKALDWMSAETKEKAIIKLDAIRAYVAYPDEPVRNILYEVKAKDEGGNLIDIMSSIREVNRKETLDALKKPIDSNIWEAVPSSTVNAFYSPTLNAIIVPAGILQSIFYDANASREENLGGIGAVIAHEITHAFDNTGAQYDKDGTITDWWTEEDYKAFKAKTDHVASELSEIAFVGDKYVKGALCTGETVADLGAMACALDIADDMEGADLSKVMETWSSVWATRMSSELSAYFLSIDPHAPHKLRVNFVLSRLKDFYDVYEITEGDEMFLPVEDRISIW